LTNLFVSFYAHLLRLYPRTFYDAYAEEMASVFRLNLETAAAHGSLAALLTFLHELLDLPLNVVREYLRKEHQPMHRLQLRGENGLRRARNLTRATSLVIALFINWSLLAAWNKPDFAIWSQSVPFVVALFVTNLLLLVAWRWERLGARLILLGAVGIGLTVAYSMFVTLAITGEPLSSVVVFLITLAWAFPYFLFGLLFLHFSRHSPLAVSPA